MGAMDGDGRQRVEGAFIPLRTASTRFALESESSRGSLVKVEGVLEVGVFGLFTESYGMARIGVGEVTF